MTERRRCGGCGQDDLRDILSLGSSPLADRFPQSATEIETRYPLNLLICDHCSLAQLQEIVPDEILWSEYGFFSSSSPALVRYQESVAQLLYDRYGTVNLAVEIACNDGLLLSQIRAKDKFGVDPAAAPVAFARMQGLMVYDQMFSSTFAETLTGVHGKADLIVAQNVVAHVADLQDFLAGVRLLLADTGKFIVEFQLLADLVLGNQFDHIYHEHRFYFSKKSFAYAAEMAGFTIELVERTPMQGGSVRITLSGAPRAWGSKTSWRPDVSDALGGFWGLQDRADYLKERLQSTLRTEGTHGLVAGYAASAKSCTLLNWCEFDARDLAYVVDTTAYKIGRFTPGTRIPIVAPGTKPDPDTYLLLAHNYLSRIRYERFNGRWIIPIPQPTVIE